MHFRVVLSLNSSAQRLFRLGLSNKRLFWLLFLHPQKQIPEVDQYNEMEYFYHHALSSDKDVLFTYGERNVIS